MTSCWFDVSCSLTYLTISHLNSTLYQSYSVSVTHMHVNLHPILYSKFLCLPGLPSFSSVSSCLHWIPAFSPPDSEAAAADHADHFWQRTDFGVTVQYTHSTPPVHPVHPHPHEISYKLVRKQCVTRKRFDFWLCKLARPSKTVQDDARIAYYLEGLTISKDWHFYQSINPEEVGHHLRVH